MGKKIFAVIAVAVVMSAISATAVLAAPPTDITQGGGTATTSGGDRFNFGLNAREDGAEKGHFNMVLKSGAPPEKIRADTVTSYICSGGRSGTATIVYSGSHDADSSVTITVTLNHGAGTIRVVTTSDASPIDTGTVSYSGSTKNVKGC